MTIGRDFAKAIVRNALDEGRLEMGEPVILKRLIGANPGDPTKGVSPTYTFELRRTRAVVSSLTHNDITYAGGIYQLGDMNVQLNEELREISDTAPGIGDRVIYQSNEYRVVGKTESTFVVNDSHVFTYVMRKVNT